MPAFAQAQARHAEQFAAMLERWREMTQGCEDFQRRQDAADRRAAAQLGDLMCRVGAVLNANPNFLQNTGNRGSVTIGPGQGVNGFDPRTGRPNIVRSAGGERREVFFRQPDPGGVAVVGAIASLCLRGERLRGGG